MEELRARVNHMVPETSMRRRSRCGRSLRCSATGTLRIVREPVAGDSAELLLPGPVPEAEARAHWQSIFATFPDFRMDALATTAEDDRIVAEISHGGTMQGKMGPKEPTGRPYRLTGAFRMDFSGGKIQRIQTNWDTASMLDQLGLLPK